MAKENSGLFLIGRVIFEWDPAKAVTNLHKHGVSFEEAASVFSDEEAVLMDDPEHSYEEDRLLLLGYSAGRRILSVVHVERGSGWRIISARNATRREKRSYEKGQG